MYESAGRDNEEVVVKLATLMMLVCDGELGDLERLFENEKS